ncbi:hypothetical protein [Paraburkholderia sp. BL6665CI2N2]|uniref:hypothetical protein n=1 Tax=Paraburkholderia sp. BL6665CI2N2 TaxID=1938806 RepID=UPI0014170F71|nr:hypothetical protein [Paraburkholderia sp. BL6665CI2N2]
MSNDNPFSDSLFKTLVYRPACPLQTFDALFAARTRVARLVHSAIRFRHAGPAPREP